MADLNWCTSCDNAVSPFSESLYCSEQCLRADALRNHPLLGYTYPEFTDFPRPNKPTYNNNNSTPSPKLSYYSNYSSASTSPALTATSSTSDASSIQFSSPPKFDLTCSTTNNKMNGFNYFSIFSSNDHNTRTTSI